MRKTKKQKSKHLTFSQFTNAVSTISENASFEWNDKSLLIHWRDKYSFFRIVLLAFRNNLRQLNNVMYDTLIMSPMFCKSLLGQVMEDNHIPDDAVQAFISYYGIECELETMSVIAEKIGKSVSYTRKYIKKAADALTSAVYRCYCVDEAVGAMGMDYFTRPLDTIDAIDKAWEIIKVTNVILDTPDDEQSSISMNEFIGKLFGYGGGIQTRVTSRMYYDGFDEELIWEVRCANNWITKERSAYTKPVESRQSTRHWKKYIREHQTEISDEIKYAYANGNFTDSIIHRILHKLNRRK